MKNTTIILSVLSSLFILGCQEPAYPAEIHEDVLKTIAMESANQSDEGMYLVASVIVNRASVSGKTLLAICKAPKQFSCWNSPKWAREWCTSHFDQKARKRAKKAIEMAIIAPFPEINHYHTKAVRPYWANKLVRVKVEGQHVFYREAK